MTKPLSFSEQYHYLKNIKIKTDEEIISWLDQHPNSTLVLTEVMLYRPEILFKLRSLSPEFALGMINSFFINPSSKDRTTLLIEFERCLANEYFEKHPFVGQIFCLAFFRKMEQNSAYFSGMGPSYTISGNGNLLPSDDLSEKSRLQQMVDKIKRKQLCYLIKRNPEKIAEIEYPNEELLELAIKANPLAIQFIKQPNEKLLRLAIKLNPELFTSIEHPSEELCLLAITLNVDWFFKLKNPPLIAQRYAIFKDVNRLKKISLNFKLMPFSEDPISLEEWKWLALQSDPETVFRAIDSKTSEMIDYSLIKCPKLINEIKSPTPQQWEIALMQDVGCLIYFKGDRTCLFEKILDVFEKRLATNKSLGSVEFAMIQLCFPKNIERLRKGLTRLESLKKTYGHSTRFELHELPSKWLERLFAEFPTLISFDNQEIPSDLLFQSLVEDIKLIKHKNIILEEESVLILQHFFSGIPIDEQFERIVSSHSLRKIMEDILEQANLERRHDLSTKTELSPKECLALIQENPLNLAFIPMRNRSLQICRLACLKDSNVRIFSPFHFEVFWEEKLHELGLTPDMKPRSFYQGKPKWKS